MARTLISHKRVVLSTWGISWTVDAQSWLFVLPNLLVGLVAAWLFAPTASLSATIATGVGYGLLLILIMLMHAAGHILSSRLVAPAMTEARVTPLRIETRYDDDPASLSPYVHLVRAMGGPALNVFAGTLALLVWLTVGGHGLLFFALASKVIGLAMLLPFAGLDGAVVWRELNQLAHE